MSFKSVIPGTGGGGGGTITLAANSVYGNYGTTSAAGTSVTVGDTLNGGLYMNPSTGRFTGTPPTLYYLTTQPDASGIAGAYTAARVPNTSLTATLTAALTGTTITTVADFYAPAGDPGAIAYAAGSVQGLLYASIDAGSVTLSIRTLLVRWDGTEVNMGTATTPANFTATTVTAVTIPLRKLSSQSVGAGDRILFRVMATRVAGSPTTVNLSLYFDPTNQRNTMTSTISGTGRSSATYNDYNVMDANPPAVADLISLPDGVMANGSPTLVSASAVSSMGGFQSWMVGKTIEVSGALGAASAPLLTTILAVVNTSTITLSANATAATGTQFLSSATVPPPDLPSVGNYVQTDTLDLVGGTGTVTAQVQVQTTNVRDVVVNNAGSLGAAGLVTLQGTTGTGTPARFRATVLASGALDPASITILGGGGVYLTNPSSLSAEPVTVVDGTNTLVGATVTITMDVRSVVPVTAGSYSVVPTDPIATSAGSVSGATGAVLNGAWGSTGRTQIGTDNGTVLTAALTAAIAQQNSGRRVRVVFPAGNFGVFSGAFPFITAPIEIVGAGPEATQIYVGEGYTGAHVFGPSTLFDTSAGAPGTGPNTMVSSTSRGMAIRDLSIYGNQTATVKPMGICAYDRVAGLLLQNVTIANFANHGIRTGLLNTETSSYLQEFFWSNVRVRACGATNTPAVYFNSIGTGGPTNDGYIDDLEVIFPLSSGVVFAGHNADKIDGLKIIRIDKLRVELQGGNPSSATGDLLAFGSFDSTDNVQNVSIGTAFLLSAQSAGSALAFYGATPRLAPSRISIDNLYVFGGTSYGNGISLNAANNITIGVRQIVARTAGIAIAATTTRERNGTVGSGSTTGNVVLDASASSTTDAYTGGAAIVTSTATGTGVIASGVLTVSSAVTTAGQYRVGSRIIMSGLTFGITIGSLGSGSGGNGSYNLLRNGLAYTGSLSSRAVTAIATQTRQGLGYNGTTKTLTIGAIQGSSATWDWAPVSGEAFSIQSLLTAGSVRIDDSGDGPGYTYSVGTNSSNILRNYIYPVGTPGTTQTVDQPYSWSAANTFSTLVISDTYTINGSTSGTITLNAAAAAGTYEWDWPITAGTAGQVLTSQGGAGTPMTWTTPATGSVTSVAETFTGGLISVAGSPITGAGTLALTVAGTSGGIPYFNSATSWATSALLTDNALVLGRGAGAAPRTLGAFYTNGVSTLTIGATGSGSGSINLVGTTSGTINIGAFSTAGTWNFNMPTSAGSSGQPLLSGGGGASAMTWGTVGVPAGGTGLTAWTANTLVYASATATLAGAVLPPGWTFTSGTLVPSSTITVGLSNSLTDTITAGTYDLGPFIQGGTVQNSYAHVASGTLTYTGAIGQPGIYTAITGMNAITSTSTTIDTIGTATAANVIAAGAHLWVIIGGTPPPGGDVFFTVKVP